MKVKRDALNEIVQNLTVKLYEQAAQQQAASSAFLTSSASTLPSNSFKVLSTENNKASTSLRRSTS
jgi:molecular chaperone DnaK